MAVYKRTPGLDADYYVGGSTVRRPAWEGDADTRTRRVPDNRSELFKEKTSTAAQRRTASATQRPVRDTRTLQDRRRAEPTRAYYEAEPTTRRLTHEEVNRRANREHMRQRVLEEQQRAEQEHLRREAEQEELRRRQHRIVTLFSVIAIAAVCLLASGIFVVLNRYARIDAMVVEQRELTSDIEEEQKRLEELQVEINMQGNIATIQDYARESLNMDYATAENTRTIALPE